MMDAVKLEKLFGLLGGLAYDQSTMASNFSMAEMVNAPQAVNAPIPSQESDHAEAQAPFADIAAIFRENDLEMNHDVVIDVAPQKPSAPVQGTPSLYADSVAGFNRMGTQARKIAYAATARVMTTGTHLRTYVAPKVGAFTNHAANVLPFRRRQPA